MRTRGLVLLGCLALLPAAGRGIERRCSYRLFVKSDVERVSSVELPNGLIVAKGSYPEGDAKDERREARERASKAATLCLDAAVASAGLPPACRRKSQLGRMDRSMERYDLEDLKQVALETFCRAAETLGKEGVLDGVQIYAVNVTDVEEATKYQCALNDRIDPYYTPVGGLGLKVECRRGQRAREAEAPGYWTGWYDESASQIRERVTKYCDREFRLQSYRIQEWQVNPANGHLRAAFECR